MKLEIEYNNCYRYAQQKKYKSQNEHKSELIVEYSKYCFF
jgi:hypothetical protein